MKRSGNTMDKIQSKNLNDKPIVVKSDVYKEKSKEM